MHHEAIGQDEKFVGNTDKGRARVDWLHERGVRSARLGTIALDLDGKRLSGQYKPVIIARAHEGIYDSVMMRATFGDGYRRY